jgi:predicted AlkP superfamily phosphohydrolase/phosphomutase
MEGQGDAADLSVLEETHERASTELKNKLGERVGQEILDMTTLNQFKPDLSRSRALPQSTIYIYVNLKGRDPGGVVPPEDYEKVQREIIEALYSYVDPQTGTRPVSLALSRQDARILGLHGEGVGDVVYAIYPEFGGQHGPQLPTASWGVGKLNALLSFSGPGIKKGLSLQRTSGLTDIVPTVCYLMNWPLPANAEGAVLYQIFDDPDFRSNENKTAPAARKRVEKKK